MFNLLSFFFLSLLVTMETFGQKKFNLQNQKQHFSTMVPCHLHQENLYCLSHCKIRWTMTMDNVGMKIGLWGTSSSMVTPTLFS